MCARTGLGNSIVLILSEADADSCAMSPQNFTLNMYSDTTQSTYSHRTTAFGLNEQICLGMESQLGRSAHAGIIIFLPISSQFHKRPGLSCTRKRVFHAKVHELRHTRHLFLSKDDPISSLPLLPITKQGEEGVQVGLW